MVRCGAGFGAVLRKPNRGGRSGDLFGKLKAESKLTTQTRKKERG